MTDHTDYLANNPDFQKKKAIKALALAKKIEMARMKSGARYQQVNHNTWILKD